LDCVPGKNDAIKAFNAAVELMRTDAVGSIGSFEIALIMEQIGDSAYDIQIKADRYYRAYISES